MIDAEVFVGETNIPLDYGVVDAAGAPIDLSTTTAKNYTIETPDGVSEDVAVTFLTDGVDGNLRYVRPSIDQAGIWRFRAWYTNPAGTYYADWLEFFAKPNEDSSVDDTWGGANSNVYITVSDASDFITSNVVDSSAWISYDEPKRAAALLEATRDIDAYQYLGERYFYTQLLEFPRTFRERFPWGRTALSPSSFSIEQHRMQVAVRKACCYQALWILRNAGRNLHIERMMSGIKSIQQIAGQAQEAITYGNLGTASRLCPEAAAVLKPYRGSKTCYRG